MIAGIVFGIISAVASGNWLVGVAVTIAYVILAFAATPRDTW